MAYTDSAGGPPLFDWDEGNLSHIAKHDVEPSEAEEAILDPNRVSRTAYSSDGERRDALLGTTEEGRRLFVIFIRRGAAIRVISARDTTDAEKRVYRNRGK